MNRIGGVRVGGLPLSYLYNPTPAVRKSVHMLILRFNMAEGVNCCQIVRVELKLYYMWKTRAPTHVQGWL